MNSTLVRLVLFTAVALTCAPHGTAVTPRWTWANWIPRKPQSDKTNKLTAEKQLATANQLSEDSDNDKSDVILAVEAQRLIQKLTPIASPRHEDKKQLLALVLQTASSPLHVVNRPLDEFWENVKICLQQSGREIKESPISETAPGAKDTSDTDVHQTVSRLVALLTTTIQFEESKSPKGVDVFHFTGVCPGNKNKRILQPFEVKLSCAFTWESPNDRASARDRTLCRQLNEKLQRGTEGLILGPSNRGYKHSLAVTCYYVGWSTQPKTVIGLALVSDLDLSEDSIAIKLRFPDVLSYMSAPPRKREIQFEKASEIRSSKKSITLTMVKQWPGSVPFVIDYSDTLHRKIDTIISTLLPPLQAAARNALSRKQASQSAIHLAAEPYLNSIVQALHETYVLGRLLTQASEPEAKEMLSAISDVRNQVALYYMSKNDPNLPIAINLYTKTAGSQEKLIDNQWRCSWATLGVPSAPLFSKEAPSNLPRGRLEDVCRLRLPQLTSDENHFDNVISVKLYATKYRSWILKCVYDSLPMPNNFVHTTTKKVKGVNNQVIPVPQTPKEFLKNIIQVLCDKLGESKNPKTIGDLKQLLVFSKGIFPEHEEVANASLQLLQRLQRQYKTTDNAAPFVFKQHFESDK